MTNTHIEDDEPGRSERGIGQGKERETPKTFAISRYETFGSNLFHN